MESTDNTTIDTTTPVSEEPAKVARPEYAGDKGEWAYNFVRDTPIEKKPIAMFSYGRRVRIAALWENYESMMDHVVQVGGWARTTRMGGKDFAFIELTDGSSGQTLQVVVDSSMPNFAEVSKATVGYCFKVKGKLIRSPAKGQPFEL